MTEEQISELIALVLIDAEVIVRGAWRRSRRPVRYVWGSTPTEEDDQ